MEMERKFLVKQIPNLWNVEHKELEQYYVSFSPEVRVRKSNNKYYLTIKSSGNLAREEVEMSIDKENFDRIKNMSQNNRIIKTRYYIPHAEFVCELDVYHNIKGLFTVEVEFENKDDAKIFDVPEWFGDEITNIEEFKNKNLAQHGIPYEVKCPICMGKGGSYDRMSMAHHTCSKCNGKGVIDINSINIGKYNQLIKEY